MRPRPIQATNPAAESATRMMAITEVPAPVNPDMGTAGVEVDVLVGVGVKKTKVGRGVELTGFCVTVGVAGMVVDVPTREINNFWPAIILSEARLFEL